MQIGGDKRFHANTDPKARRWEAVMNSIIAKRCVFHIGGYDPTMPPEVVYPRFVREVRRFEHTWSASVSVSKPKYDEDQVVWEVVTRGANWRVETEFRFVRWDDIINSVDRRPMWKRIPLGALAFVDFIAAGAFWGYLRTNWRYALFFLWPFVLFTALIGVAYLAGQFAAQLSSSAVIGAAVGVLVLTAVLRGPVRWMYLPQLMDDWIFTREYIRNGHPLLDQRLIRIAQQIRVLAMEADADEVLVVGHSLGAVLAVDLLDKMLTLHPAGGLKGSPLAFVSIGSSILKVALHRAAGRFRAALRRVGETRTIYWIEYQALTDVMNFYKTNPLVEIGMQSTGRPSVRIVRIRHMLNFDFYRKIRRNFYRVHAQFVSGNDKRTAYDYFMMLCGPLSLERQARLPEGAASAIDERGMLRQVGTRGEWQHEGAGNDSSNR